MLGRFPGLLYATDVEIRSVCGYVDVVGTYLEKEANSFQTNLEARIKAAGLDENGAAQFYAKIEDDVERWSSSFPTLVRSSALISACSLLEVSLTDICKSLEHELVSAIGTSWAAIDKKIPPLLRAACHLRKNFQIHLDDHPAWTKVLDHFIVRNAVVHARGDRFLLRDKKSRDGLNDALTRLKFVGLEMVDDRLHLHDAYLKLLLDDIGLFWSDLQNAFIANAHTGPKYWP